MIPSSGITNTSSPAVTCIAGPAGASPMVTGVRRASRSIAAALRSMVLRASSDGAGHNAASFAPGAMPSSFFALRTLVVRSITQSIASVASFETLARGSGHWARISS